MIADMLNESCCCLELLKDWYVGRLGQELLMMLMMMYRIEPTALGTTTVLYDLDQHFCLTNFVLDPIRVRD